MHYDSHLNATFGFILVFFSIERFFSISIFPHQLFFLSPFWLNFFCFQFDKWHLNIWHIQGNLSHSFKWCSHFKKLNYTTEVLFLNIGDQVSIIIYCIIFVQLFFTNLFLFPYFISHSIFFAPYSALSLSIFRSPHFHFKSFE